MSFPTPSTIESGSVSASPSSLLKNADLPGTLFDLKTITATANKSKNPSTVPINKAIPVGTSITIKQALSIFTLDFDGSQLPSPQIGPLKLVKFSNGLVLQDAQVNSNGEMQWTFGNPGGVKGADGQVAGIQVTGQFGTGEPRPGGTTSGGTITWLFALK